MCYLYTSKLLRPPIVLAPAKVALSRFCKSSAFSRHFREAEYSSLCSPTAQFKTILLSVEPLVWGFAGFGMTFGDSVSKKIRCRLQRIKFAASKALLKSKHI
jgi:hypothetical protein